MPELWALGRGCFNSLGPALSRREQAGEAIGESSITRVLRGDAVSDRKRHSDLQRSGHCRWHKGLTIHYRPRLVDPWLRLQLPRAGERAPWGWSP